MRHCTTQPANSATLFPTAGAAYISLFVVSFLRSTSLYGVGFHGGESVLVAILTLWHILHVPRVNNIHCTALCLLGKILSHILYGDHWVGGWVGGWVPQRLDEYAVGTSRWWGGGGVSFYASAPPPLQVRKGRPRCSSAEPPCVTFRRVAVSLRGPGQSPDLPFACCVGSLHFLSRCGRCSCWCCFRVRGAHTGGASPRFCTRFCTPPPSRRAEGPQGGGGG